MPLAQPLAERYEALFWGYGTGGDPRVIALKGRIAEQANVLREDAMYFLLVNFDHMVIRALSGYVPWPLIKGAPGAPLPAFVPPEQSEEMAHRALTIVLDNLASHRAPNTRSSANDVIRALAVTIEDIAEVILWWRE